ncbi:protocadherin gamma-A6-like [Tiliqua scincoides]|uniref:protocadherin gamma-A6-like n=1 Tax=Tiliqua scincoides TaxID=71010 RepID=UPI003462378A
MEKAQKLWSCREGILQCLIVGVLWNVVSGQIHYSIPEEMQKGSFVGNIAKDLGMDGKHISEHGLRLTTRAGTIQYFAFNFNSGHLQTSERIDREEICARAERCIISLQVIIESKLEMYRVEVEITDINDNAPRFTSGKKKLKISEASTPGSRLPLPKAQDPDLGMNSIQSYQLRGSNHFSLDVQTGENGARHAELVLEKSLDREEQSVYDLILTATDGGDPVRSGTTEIQVVVLDANDNAPVFTQPVYKVSVKEDTPEGSTVTTVKATDLDEGLNGEIKYSFEKITEKDTKLFLLNSTTGTITLMGKLDYEESSSYEFEVKAEDGGGLSDLTKVIVSIIDLNDNAPELTVTLFINTILENSPTRTVIALLNVLDQDSGINGEVTCSIPDKLPFQLKKSTDNFYSLVTLNDLDREQVAAYNITITATDHGTPPLSASTLLSLHILDTNDNPPVFAESVYSFYVPENNPRGTSIFSLEATDPDWAENSRLSYSIIEGQVRNSLLSSYVSINSETGVVYALSPFDYEDFQEIRFQVKAQDGGSPPLSSNVSVTLFILDQNDNAPVVLYPSPPNDGSTGVELAPRSSEPGYLVTKVVAVDADSGQNGWLSYQLIKATEPGLFTVGLHTGEIRTTRFFLEKDALKQSLVILVKDNGKTPLSASVTVTVVLADSIPDILTDLSNIAVSVDPQSDLTFYLVIAVAFVSCLFFAFLLVLLALRLRKWRNSQLCDSGSVNFHGVPASQFVGIDGVRAFLRSYCQEVSLTSGSRKSQIFFPVGSCTNTLTPQQAPDNPNPLLILGESNTNKEDAVSNQVSLQISIFLFYF